MAQIIKNIKVTWAWTGDTGLLKGFNVALVPNGADPKDGAIAFGTAGGALPYEYTFRNVVLDNAQQYKAWVQALYPGDDSDWFSTTGDVSIDDGTATVESTGGAQAKADSAQSAAESTAAADATTKADAAANAATPYTLITSGSDIEVIGAKIERVAGSVGWNDGAYSAESYTGGAYVSCRAPAIGRLMIGLNTDPALDHSYYSIDFAWYLLSNGTLAIWESGAQVSVQGTYSPGDTFAVQYDGKDVIYLHNGDISYTSLNSAPDLKLYLDSSIHDMNSRVDSIQFGPLTDSYTAIDAAALDATAKADAAEQNAKDYADGQFVTASTYGTDMAAIQSQVDGSITTWFLAGVPTLANAPANAWTDDATKNIHLGDVYYDDITGFAYRFKLAATVYSWVRITDSDVTKALADAAAAQDTADAKRRVFVTTPVVPYDQGDLWDTGTGVKRCTTARTDAEAYNGADWAMIADVTDYVATQAQADQAQSDAEATAAADATAKANKATGYTLVPHADILVVGGSATRTTGGGLWDAGVYSKEAYTGGAYASASSVTNTYAMFGLNEDPLSDSYVDLDYAIYFNGGSIKVYESGADMGSFGSFASGDALSVVYDGRDITYFHNGAVIRTVVGVGADRKFHFDASINGNDPINNIQFGPVSDLSKAVATDLHNAPNSIKNNPLPGDDGLLLYAKMEDTEFLDHSDNELAVVVGGAPTIVADGVLDNAASFDGSDDDLTYTVPDTRLNGDKTFTVMGFFRRTASFAGKGPWGIGGNAGNKGICAYVHPSWANKISMDLWANCTYDAGIDYPLNDWIHVAWVYRAGGFTTTNCSIWVDGTEYTGAGLYVRRTSSTSVDLNTSTEGVTVGGINPSTSHNAPIDVDEFRVLTREASRDEILAHKDNPRFPSLGGNLNSLIESKFDANGNLALGATFSSSGTIQNEANLTDGNKTIGTSFAEFNSAAQWVQADLGSEQFVAESHAYFYNGDDRTYQYGVAYSRDGSTWNWVIGTGDSAGVISTYATSRASIDGHYAFATPFPNINGIGALARYVRVYMNGNTKNAGNHLYEWEIWGAPTGVDLYAESLASRAAVKNSSVTIAADGTLSGAGGGQVTVGGIGAETPAGAQTKADTAANDALPFTLVNHQGTTIVGGKVTKTGGTENVWDASAYSKESYTGGAYVSCSVSQSNTYIMIGLNTDPTTDNSYSSMDYALYFEGGGNMQAWESGSRVSSGEPLYTAGDIGAVVYNGEEIQYLLNGTVFHTTAVSADQKLYLDTSFYKQNHSLESIQFGPYANMNAVQTKADTAQSSAEATAAADASAKVTAAMPFTLVATNPGNVEILGNKITKTVGIGAWDEDVYSKESFTGGAFASATYRTNTRAMFALTTDPTTNRSYNSLDYAWYFNNSNATGIYENGVSQGGFDVPADGDTFSIQYDGINVRYFHNGALKRTVAAAADLKLYFDSSIHDLNDSIENIAFGPLGSAREAANIATPLDVSTNTTGMVVAGTTFKKSGGTDGWNASAYSNNAFTGGAYVSFTASTTNKAIMMGLNTDPLTDHSFSSIDYSFYLASNGNLHIYEATLDQGQFGTYAQGDSFSIEYDGLNVTHFHNGVALRTVTADTDLKLYLDTSFDKVGAVVNNVQFGPLTNARTAANAASPLNLVADTEVTVIGSSMRGTAAAGWVNGAYSLEGYTGGAYASAVTDQTSSDMMFGLNTDPANNGAYGTIDYAIYLASGGNVKAYESNSDKGIIGTCVAGDTLSVTYDGINVQYLINGAAVRTVAAAPSIRFHFDSSFGNSACSISSIKFGPYTSNDWAKMGGVGLPADNAQVNAPSLGCKINYTNLATANTGEIYFHGFGDDGQPAEVDGYILINGVRTTLPRGFTNPNGSPGSAYIIYDNANTFETTSKYFLARKEQGSWFGWRCNVGTKESINPNASMWVIGTATQNNSELVDTASVWGSAADLTEVPDIDATAGAIWGTDITGQPPLPQSLIVLPGEELFQFDQNVTGSKGSGVTNTCVYDRTPDDTFRSVVSVTTAITNLLSIAGADGVTLADLVNAGKWATYSVPVIEGDWVRVQHNGSGYGLRGQCNEVDLVDNIAHTASIEVYNTSDSDIDVIIDWCDIVGAGVQTIKPREQRRIYATGSRVYDATYRFMDFTVNTVGASILVREPQVEKLPFPTPFTATNRSYGRIELADLHTKINWERHGMLTWIRRMSDAVPGNYEMVLGNWNTQYFALQPTIGQIRYAYTNSTPVQINVNSTFAITDDQWHLMGYEVDTANTNVRFYLDDQYEDIYNALDRPALVPTVLNIGQMNVGHNTYAGNAYYSNMLFSPTGGFDPQRVKEIFQLKMPFVDNNKVVQAVDPTSVSMAFV